jgi:BirA family biotin operon repressor/biotin-[acetyl-CoA-carboxylase] ligase
VLIDGRKVAGVLVEGRPQEDWAVAGIGLNVAIEPRDLPPELRETAGGLGLGPEAIEPTLRALLGGLERWLAASDEEVVTGFTERDALHGRMVGWSDGRGRADGIDATGRLRVRTETGAEVVLSAGEVHLLPAVDDGDPG